MSQRTLWVVGNPAAPHLELLQRLPAGVKTLVANEPEPFLASPDQPDCFMNATGQGTVVRSIWPRIANVQWYHSLMAGLENQLFPELVESAFPLTNSAGVFARSLGEWAIAGMLWFAKDLRRLHEQQGRAEWSQFISEPLTGKTVGILGYGGIGRATAERAKPFGMRVLATRKRPEKTDDVVDQMLPLDQLDTLCRESDYLVIAAPKTPETIGLVDERRLRLMKKGAVLINLGRGPIVDEPALIQALQEGWIKGAALDVFNVEPLPADHPFWKMPNVLISPHCADHTTTWLHEAMELFLDNFSRWERGEPLRNLADKRHGY
jgi:phosphoglycerate dehydrogenase-like enzyme